MATSDKMNKYDTLNRYQKGALTRKINIAKKEIQAIEARPETGGTLSAAEKRQIRNLQLTINAHIKTLDDNIKNIKAKAASEKINELNRMESEALASQESELERKRVEKRHSKYDDMGSAEELEAYNKKRKVQEQRAKQTKSAEDKIYTQTAKDNAVRDQAKRKLEDSVYEDYKLRSKKESKAKRKAGYGPNTYGASEYDVEDYDTWRKKAKDTRMEFMKSTTPSTKKKFKPPAKSIVRTGLGAGLGMYLGNKAADFHESADEHPSLKYDRLAGNSLDIIAPLGGLGALGFGGILANETAVNKLKSMYDPYGTEGLSRTELYKRYMSDVGGASKDVIPSKMNKLAAQVYRSGQKTGFSPNPDYRLAIADIQQNLSDRKKDRWTNRPAIKKEKEKLKQIERDKLTRELDYRSSAQKMADANAGLRDTATHNSVRNNIDTRINDLRSSLNSNALMAGNDPVVSADLSSKINKLEASRAKLDSIPEYELAKSSEYKDFTPGKVQEGHEKIKKQSKKAARKLKKSADATASAATGIIDDSVKPAAQGFVDSTKQKATDVLNRAVGRPVAQVPKAGLSQAPDTEAVTETKKPTGKITKAAKVGGAVATGVAPGGALNFALKTKRDLEEQGISPQVQYLIDSGASEAEVNEAIREDMYATAFRNTGIPEMADQVTNWLDTDMSAYDRTSDVLSTGGDVVTGMAQGIYDSAMGLGDLYSRTKDWATGEGEFGALYNQDGTKRTIMGYDTPEGMFSPGAAFASNQYANDLPQSKKSGITPARTEGEDSKNKRKQAEAYNAQQAASREAAMRKAIALKKYSGYTSDRDYANAYGVKTATDHFGVKNDGRYGDTPIYVSADGTSFSDVPTNVMDPAKYDKVAGQAANKARQQYIKFDKAMKEQAKQQARGPAFANMTDEQYDTLGLAGQSKALLDYNKSMLSRKGEKDLYDRNLDVAKGLRGEDKTAYINTLADTAAQKQTTAAQRAQISTAINEARIKEGWKVPFMDTPDPRAFGTHENVPGVVFENVPDELKSLSSAYDYDIGYKPE